MNKKILIVAAHPDDEVLGCGGTILKHVYDGDIVHILFLTDGESSRPETTKLDIGKRKIAAESARSILGAKQIINLGMPDNRLDSLDLIDVVKSIEKIISNIKPDIIYTHFYGDLNIDHQIANKAVMVACRPLPNNTVKEIYCFEVISSTEWSAPKLNVFSPNLYVDITNQLDKKLEALKAYKFEMRNKPHSRSVDHIVALAKHRGYSCGFEAAEAFMIMRILK